MPYKSDKQRRWAHTEDAKKSGFPTEEFDKASKGKSPNMAEGGMAGFPYKDDYVGEGKDLGFLDIPKNADSPITNMSDPGVAGLRDNLEPGIMDETMPPEMKALKALADTGVGFGAAEMGGGMMGKAMDLGEEGMASLGKAPNMDLMKGEEAPKLEVYLKGIQKGVNGAKMKLWNVKGDPSEIEKLGFGREPASIPEDVLRKHGLLPDVVKNIPTNSPNGYAEGGMVQDSGWKEKVNKYFSGGAVDFPHKEKSGPELNSVSHQKYADGGMVEDDGTDWMKGAAEKAAVPAINMPIPDVPKMPDTGFMNQLQRGTTGMPKFNPQAGLPPPAPMPVQPPQSPVLGANSIQDYVGAQKAQLDKYGPDQQKAVTNQLIQQRQGLGSKIPVALGGLADSLMQGVARAGNPGFADRIQGQQNLLAGEKMGAMEKAGTQNIQQTEAKMKLDAIDAQSPLSKSKQQEYEPLLTKLGYKKEQIARMSSSDIENATALMAQFGGKEIEAVIKRFELGLEAQKTAETGRHNRAEEEAKGEEVGVSAAKEILNGSKIPGVPPTHAAKLGAENVLEKAAGVGQPNAQDQQAIQWAQTHPTDPRATTILKLHGMR